MAADLPVIESHVKVVHSIAATLDPVQGDCASRERRFSDLREQLQGSDDAVRQQMGKVLASFQPGLFAGGDTADLPPDNLDLERWVRNPKGHERRIHGHHHAGVRIVLEGPTLIHVLDHHQRSPEPLTAADMLPYRQASSPPSQLEALARRRLMRRARSSKQRPVLFAELQARYQDSA